MITGWPSRDGCSALAHRGGASLGPPNSLAVVELAATAGAHAVEIDVQELADGTLVLFHDSKVEVGEQVVPLAHLLADDVERASGVALPTLAELLDLLTLVPLGLYLDVKRVTESGLRRAIDAVCASPIRDRAVVGSFDPGIVGHVVADGRLRASLLYHDTTLDPLALADRYGCALVHPCFDHQPWMVERLAGEWMDRVHSAGLSVVGWNTNDAELLAAMSVAGFDAVCTDDPRLV